MKRRFTIEELRNKKFYHLTLLEPQSFIKNGISRRFWLCECDCGKRLLRRESFIIDGKTKSCGCQHPCKKSGKENILWRGCGDISGQHFTEIKCRSKKCGQEFSVTIEYLWDIFIKQDRKCALTGVEICFYPDRWKRRGLIQTASLDRIDSSKGYAPENVWWVHKDINKIKMEFSVEKFFELCKLVVIHNKL